jgi:hypothetical protein
VLLGKTTLASNGQKLSMNSRFWLIVFLLFLWLRGTPALSANQGWTLELFSDMCGQISIIWIKEAIRIDLKKYDLVMISKAPTWRMLIFSDSTKRYCECSLEQFRTRFGQEKQRHDPNDTIIKTKESARLVGLNATKYFLLRKKKQGLDWSDKCEVWMTKDPNIPIRIGNVLAEMAALPSNYGIPIKALRIRNNGVTVRTIEALAYHQVPIKAGLFKGPVGYKKVNDELAVLMEDDMDTLIEEQADLLSKGSGRHDRNDFPNASRSR